MAWVTPPYAAILLGNDMIRVDNILENWKPQGTGEVEVVPDPFDPEQQCYKMRMWPEMPSGENVNTGVDAYRAQVDTMLYTAPFRAFDLTFSMMVMPHDDEDCSNKLIQLHPQQWVQFSLNEAAGGVCHLICRSGSRDDLEMGEDWPDIIYYGAWMMYRVRGCWQGEGSYLDVRCRRPLEQNWRVLAQDRDTELLQDTEGKWTMGLYSGRQRPVTEYVTFFKVHAHDGVEQRTQRP